MTAALRRRAFRAALRRLGVRQPILWLLRPFHADQIGLYDEKLVVYHVTDAYSDFPLIADKDAFRRDEEALLRRADLVIVTSPGLLASKRTYNPHTYLVPNAVDYAGFQAALADPDCRLASADAIARPHIGYVGALNEKIEFDLLEHVARGRPEWQLLLVGSLDLTVHPDKADALRRAAQCALARPPAGAAGAGRDRQHGRLPAALRAQRVDRQHRLLEGVRVPGVRQADSQHRCACGSGL